MTDAKDNSAGALTLKQLTPVLIVETVEPCIKFWTDRLGFAVNNQVPDPDGKLIFASVEKGGIEIMAVLSRNRANPPDESCARCFSSAENFAAPTTVASAHRLPFDDM